MINAAIVGLGRWDRRLVDSVQGEGMAACMLPRFSHGTTRTPAEAAAYAARRGIALTDSLEALLAAGLQVRALRLRHASH